MPGRAQSVMDADLKPSDPSLANMFDNLRKVTPADRVEWLTEKLAAVEATPGQWGSQYGIVRRRFFEEVQRRGNEVAVAKTLKFWDVEGVEMFKKKVRVGKF